MSDREQKKPDRPYKVCFVCLGNICRSPTAEGIFRHLVRKEGLHEHFLIDSAGTSGWHTGERANSRSRQVAERRGVVLNSRARQFEAADLEEFDLILAMDEQNYSDIVTLVNGDGQKEKVKMMREFDPNPGDGNVPDPYYGGMDGFDHVFDVLERSCRQLLDTLGNESGKP